MNSAERIAALFAGYGKFHGQYRVLKKSDSGKMEGRAITVPGPATIEMWQGHLSGKGAGVGIIPLLEDNTVSFGAIDVDKYGLDFSAVEAKIKARNLPLVMCRSKSGGLHLYVFFSDPVDAIIATEFLSKWSSMLGFGGCEIFPKQTSRLNDRDIGNWINMPYFEAENTLRWAWVDGRQLSLEEFLEAAEASKTSVEEIDEHQPADSIFIGGPPCLQHLEANGGFPEGTRNNGMFNVIVYLRKKYGDTWEQHLSEYNNKLCSPPIPLKELSQLAKSNTKKEYEYRCSEAPISSHCNRSACRKCEFGVGETAMDVQIEIRSITKFEGDPVLWAIQLGDKRVMITTDDLLNPGAFVKICAEQLNRVPTSMPKPRWNRIIDKLIQNADIVTVPEDASANGQFALIVEQFTTGGNQARSRDEVILNKVWLEEGRVYFRSRALMAYLSVQKFKYESEHHVWQALRNLGAEKEFWNLNGRGVNVWSVPEPEKIQVEAPVIKPAEEQF